MKIGIVDYNAGNLRSVETAIKYLEYEYIITSDPDKLIKTDRLIFPGVGESLSAMKTLKDKGLDQAIKNFYASGKYVLGICLGSQIVLEESEEGNAKCLGIIPGRVKRFSLEHKLKIPHMGWNKVYYDSAHPVFNGLPSGFSAYFVHSYYPSPQHKKNIIAVTEYGISFPSAVCRDNCIAFQFHPEKSGEYGLKLLSNFLSLKE